ADDAIDAPGRKDNGEQQADGERESQPLSTADHLGADGLIHGRGFLQKACTTISKSCAMFPFETLRVVNQQDTNRNASEPDSCSDRSRTPVFDIEHPQARCTRAAKQPGLALCRCR